MDIFYFLLRYIPFWTIPMALIAGEFGYVYWLKSYQHLAYFLFFITLLCIGLNGFYFWAGGPDKVVPKWNELISLSSYAFCLLKMV